MKLFELLKRYFSLNHQEKPIQFFFERNDGKHLISGILDVDSLEGFAESIEDYLNQSPNNNVVITKIIRGSIL